ncbi:TonB-dependent receptor [Novosphingobium pentaromativorans]|uniref:TonB-dependent receptor, plug n=1 Tax=Novosphingobium pentaromativorans US6-1 TaxID=1088721 RepID=G6EGW3_9SPHN|nr:TonB-dependent receptor [Novosphingobium pentaromativorans US6-1]EHJ59252.1 TonB-dependent receptor, plug [Novosphingobium pentaromativorans US6-1]
MKAATWLLAAALALPAPALAREAMVSTRAGKLGDAVSELARQTGTSIVIADPDIARRPIPSLRGRMQAGEAVRRLARAAGARAVEVAPSAWRLDAAPRQAGRSTPPPHATSQVAGPDRTAPPEPIVVIASKRDLRFDQVPGQVSILDGEALETGGIGGTEKITQRLATVTSTHLGSGRNKLFIRGIADSSFTGPTQATVGQYLGDLRLAYNAPDPDLRLSDMARVEVLEGPQGTLYGAGSLGGIIRIVPNAPVMGATRLYGTLGGSLTQSGDFGGDASATINLPLSGDSAALRATFDAVRQGGYIDKPALGRDDVNRTDILGGRVSARFEISPSWSVDVIALGQATEAADSQYADRHGAPLESSSRVAEGSDADYAMGQFVVSGRIGALHLRSTTGLVRQHLQERYDASLPEGAPRLFEQTNRTRMIANETRVWMPERYGISWLLGTSFTHNTTVLKRRFESEELRSSTTGVRNTIDEATLYGEASLRIMESLVATAGGRFTYSRLGGSGEDVSRELAMALAQVTAERSLETFLPSLALHAEIAPETALYMRYQQGFRPGGFAIESEFVRRFRNDRTETFEIGARHGRAGTGPFDFALSLSYTRWQDIQADFIDGSGLPSTANIGDGRVWSVSASGGAAIAPGLRVEAGVTWNRSQVDTPPLFLVARTMQVPNIAHVAGRVGVTWEREVGGGLRLTGNGWASYVGRSRLGVGPELGAPQGDYLDSGANLRLGTDRLGLTVGLTNIANSRGNRFSLGTPFSVGREQVTPLRPRTLRVGIDTRF